MDSEGLQDKKGGKTEGPKTSSEKKPNRFPNRFQTESNPDLGRREKNHGQPVSQELDHFRVQTPIGRNDEAFFTELDSEKQIDNFDFCVTLV